jgi:hypothetical protein
VADDFEPVDRRDEHMFRMVAGVGLDRRHQLILFEPSLMMLRPGVPALDRDAALELVAELRAVHEQIHSLRFALRTLLEERPDIDTASSLTTAAKRSPRGGTRR